MEVLPTFRFSLRDAIGPVQTPLVSDCRLNRRSRQPNLELPNALLPFRIADCGFCSQRICDRRFSIPYSFRYSADVLSSPRFTNDAFGCLLRTAYCLVSSRIRQRLQIGYTIRSCHFKRILWFPWPASRALPSVFCARERPNPRTAERSFPPRLSLLHELPNGRIRLWRKLPNALLAGLVFSLTIPSTLGRVVPERSFGTPRRESLCKPHISTNSSFRYPRPR